MYTMVHYPGFHCHQHGLRRATKLAPDLANRSQQQVILTAMGLRISLLELHISTTLRLMRGAGLRGLRGMLPVREGIVIRPVKERCDPALGRVILKSVNPDYLVRGGEATEYE